MTDADILRLAAHWQAYRDSKEPTLRGAGAIVEFARALLAAGSVAALTDTLEALFPVPVAPDPVEHEGATCD